MGGERGIRIEPGAPLLRFRSMPAKVTKFALQTWRLTTFTSHRLNPPVESAGALDCFA
jgi:hypothetical protein